MRDCEGRVCVYVREKKHIIMCVLCVSEIGKCVRGSVKWTGVCVCVRRVGEGMLLFACVCEDKDGWWVIDVSKEYRSHV